MIITGNKIEDELVRSLNSEVTRPYLFIGSGFSRRYIGLDNWEGLLRIFAAKIGGNYDKLSADADGKKPLIASYISSIYRDNWFSTQEYTDYKKKFPNVEFLRDTALKAAISEYYQEKLTGGIVKEYESEVEAFTRIQVDGIITTNWDCLIEQLVPNYQSMIGQESILFSRPLSLGGLYKIHGCCTDPNSLVLTDEDYSAFRQKYQYLTAKLFTILVEHPIIFIGYSSSDENINEILKALAESISQEYADKIQNKFYYVNRPKNGQEEGIFDHQQNIGGYSLSGKKIITNDYTIVYDALSKIQRKLPLEIAQFIEQQMYDIVIKGDPQGVIKAAQIENIKEFLQTADQKHEFLAISFGRAYHSKGAVGVKRDDLINNVLKNEECSISEDIILQTIPKFQSSVAIPLFKYLVEGHFLDEHYRLIKKIPESVKERIIFYNLKNDGGEIHGWNVNTRLSDVKVDIEKGNRSHIKNVLKIKPELINDEELLLFLNFIYDDFLIKDHYKSEYCKVVCLYDWIKYVEGKTIVLE